MYKLTPKQSATQQIRLQSVDQRLRIAYLQAGIAWLMKYPDAPLPIVACGFRDEQEQQRLWDQGRTTPGLIVTWVKPGKSKHNRYPSEALDIAFLDEHGQADWDPTHFSNFALLMKQAGQGVSWGGDWRKKKDRPHFEVAAPATPKPVAQPSNTAKEPKKIAAPAVKQKVA